MKFWFQLIQMMISIWVMSKSLLMHKESISYIRKESRIILKKRQQKCLLLIRLRSRIPMLWLNTRRKTSKIWKIKKQNIWLIQIISAKYKLRSEIHPGHFWSNGLLTCIENLDWSQKLSMLPRMSLTNSWARRKSTRINFISLEWPLF